MEEEISRLLRMLIAYLLIDFLNRRPRGEEIKSRSLYFPAFLSSVAIYLAAAVWAAFWIIPVYFIYRLLFLKWRSGRLVNSRVYLLDQVAQLFGILLIWMVLNDQWSNLVVHVRALSENAAFWWIATGYVLVAWPMGIFIGLATERWRNEPGVNTDGLASAGMWIGLLERVLIFTFILIGEYTAIGFLIAAKSILRFNDKEKTTQKKTEYVLIGTLMSVLFSLILGIVVKSLSGLS